MPWLPEPTLKEVAGMLFAPVLAPYTLVYAATYYSYDGGQDPPDWQANIRNSAIWTASAISVFAWNAIVHPGKYPFMSPSSVWKIAIGESARAIGFAAIPMGIGVAAVAAQAHTLSSPPPPEYRGSGQSGWWRSVSQALTGTGPGVGTWQP